MVDAETRDDSELTRALVDGTDAWKFPLQFRWEEVTRLRDEARRRMKQYGPDVAEAVATTVSELGENVVKYGVPVRGMECGRISVERAEGRILVESSNGCTEPARTRRVLEEISQISRAPDCRELYVERLRTALEAPADEPSRLGFVRIAYEAGFALSARTSGNILTVRAEREIG